MRKFASMVILVILCALIWNYCVGSRKVSSVNKPKYLAVVTKCTEIEFEPVIDFNTGICRNRYSYILPWYNVSAIDIYGNHYNVIRISLNSDKPYRVGELITIYLDDFYSQNNYNYKSYE